MFRFVFINYWRFALFASVVNLWAGSTMTAGGFPRAVWFSLAGVWAFSAFASWLNRRKLKDARKLGEDLTLYKSLWEQVSTLAEHKGALSDHDKGVIWQRAKCRADAFNREFDRVYSDK